MQKKRIIILGAGISGLTAAWYLSKTGLPLEITILEKSPRAGGWIHTDHTTLFHFEKGPRAFNVDKSPAVMSLAADLGLNKELIWSGQRPSQRYLWLSGELHRFPTNPLSFLLSPITKGLLRALLAEWRKPAKCGDETVWEFALRRFNYDVARLFFDPMVVGIFGGDIHKISVKACFPKLKNWEENYGSVTKGFLHERKEKRRAPLCSPDGVPLSGLFSFRRGIEQLIQSLLNQVPACLRYHEEVEDVSFAGESVAVKTQKGAYSADALFCALPVKEVGRLFEKHTPEIAREFLKIPSEGFTIVNCGYDAAVLPMQGFGYLIPTYAQEDILGAVFDSCVFKEHNRRQEETRLTIKLGDYGHSEEVCVEAALRGIRRHLGISQIPKAVSFKRSAQAIPQYGTGHLEKMAELKKKLCAQLPRCHFVGNYLRGVSVDQCIAGAKDAVAEFTNSCELKRGGGSL